MKSLKQIKDLLVGNNKDVKVSYTFRGAASNYELDFGTFQVKITSWYLELKAQGKEEFYFQRLHGEDLGHAIHCLQNRIHEKLNPELYA